MTDRFPGYDVMSKRDSQSWNDKTRAVIDARLAVPAAPRLLSAAQMTTLRALADRIVPQPAGRIPIDAAAMIDEALADGHSDGYRHAALPAAPTGWQRGLDALDAEARAAHGDGFAALDGAAQDALIAAMAAGAFGGSDWDGLPTALFFTARVLSDIVGAYYAHPSAWSAIGFGGPAAPRGYVRMEADRADPWEATEARSGIDAARRNARVA